MESKTKGGRRKYLLLIDTAIFVLSALFVLLLAKFARGAVWDEGWMFAEACVITFLFVSAARLISRSYSIVWRYSNSSAYITMVLADMLGGGLAVCLIYALPSIGVSAWVNILLVAIFDIASLSSRFCYRIICKKKRAGQLSEAIPVAIIGAGQTGAMLYDELMMNVKLKCRPVLFVDRDAEKIGNTVKGLRVYDEDDSIKEIFTAYGIKEVIIGLPDLSGSAVTKLFEFYSSLGYRVKIYDLRLSDGKDGTDGCPELHDIRIEDLLFRDSIKINDTFVKGYYSGKTVLVTGGGGSIGSEICRQIARLTPKRLVIFDIYENNAYDIQQELKSSFGDALTLDVEIGSVRDTDRLDALFDFYRPDVVFHAAAHKHVPLMEHSAAEAIKNNVIGTYNTANAAEKYGVGKFVLISTDKAVNPTNVMGASKRLCEMVIQCRTDSRTSFTAVRFGNVLGSNGSVIPLFRKQIAQGGPVTVTDKRICRYFMTIPEASQLVLQAGAMAKPGDLFVLDMGEPVKIIDLAENMIRLSGLKPYHDIDIVEVGLRPGEKLYEELLIKSETTSKTDNKMIFIEHDTPRSREEIDRILGELKETLANAPTPEATERIKKALRRAVPTYKDPDEVNLSVRAGT